MIRSTTWPVPPSGRRTARLAPLLALFVLWSACTDGPAGPDGPGEPQVAMVEVTAPADTLTALGQTQQLSATALDAEGTPVTGVTFTWSSSDESVATVSGTGLVTSVGTGEVQITAAVQNVEGTAALLIAQQVTSVTVIPATATLTTAGATQQFEAEALDANGNTVADVKLVWHSERQGVGTVDSTGLAVARTSGSTTITASAAGVPGNAVLSVNQEIAALVFLTGPTDAVAGAAIDPALRVEVRDAGGSRVPDAEIAVTLSLAANPGGAALAGTKTTNAANGVATFSGLWLDRASEGYALEATAADLAPVASASFTITPAPAAALAFTTQPDNTTAGDNLAPAVQVEIQDPFGNRVPDASDPVTVGLGANPADGSLLGTVTVAAVDGVATFPDLSIERAGEGYRIEVSSGSLQGALGAGFEIAAADPVELAFLTQPGTAEGQVPFEPVEVAVRDAFGNRVTDAAGEITLALSESPSGEELGGSAAATLVDGVATFTDLTLALPGDGFVLEATSGGLPSAVTGEFDVRLTFVQETADIEHTCALTAAGFAYCWGWNGNGQLGDGTTTHRETPTPVTGGLSFAQVDAAETHTCAVTTGNDAYCWGNNDSGRLGDGTTTDRAVPTLVAGGLSFAQVSAAGGHTCGVTTGNAAYCWGSNGNSELGDGTTEQRETPTPVAGGHSFAHVSTGTHTCGVTTANDAYCWGSNVVGQLGDGTTTGRDTPTPVAGDLSFAQVSAGGGHTCGVTTGNVAYCWGYNFDGELGDGTTTQREVPTLVTGGLSFAQVSAGIDHTCGVTPDDAAYCWGSNGYGQLGDGTTTQREEPTQVSGGLSFGHVSSGHRHTCGVTTDKVGYCWGSNGAGRLGDGTTDASLEPTRVAH